MKHEIKELVTKRIYDIADGIDWLHLKIPERSQYYETWTSDPQIGGLLEQIMEQNRVRVYLKDTVMRNYIRSRGMNIQRLLEATAINFNEITQEFTKPQAVLCDNNSLYTLSTAKDWKTAVMSAFERSCSIPGIKLNLLFFTEHTTGQFVDSDYRNMIDAGASRLGVKTHWLT